MLPCVSQIFESADIKNKYLQQIINNVKRLQTFWVLPRASDLEVWDRTGVVFLLSLSWVTGNTGEHVGATRTRFILP